MSDGRLTHKGRERALKSERACPACQGTGNCLVAVAFAEQLVIGDCPACKGTGLKPQKASDA